MFEYFLLLVDDFIVDTEDAPRLYLLPILPQVVHLIQNMSSPLIGFEEEKVLQVVEILNRHREDGLTVVGRLGEDIDGRGFTSKLVF